MTRHQRNENLRAIFEEAMEVAPPDRDAWIQKRCADCPSLGAELIGLLGMADDSSFMATAPSISLEDLDAGPDRPDAIGPPNAIGRILHPAIAGEGLAAGDRIGPYEIVRMLGEGGFGVVYLAERRAPMVQRVAIKVIKPGMDSRAVVARFEQERQTLAVMDHPNVARVFDGGIAAGGRPYFVMEYVEGESITTYCDRHRLGITARLGLFIQVCDAVQHAHMKGIIHRDIKPSNILVSPGGGGAATPKVIDFGVAKAIGGTSIQGEMALTEQWQRIGTPQYMSPEQAEPRSQDIDTRTDVYSLGVVLYELLTGTPVVDASELKSRTHAEIDRVIRDTEPRRPSERLASMDASRGTEIAAQRGQQRSTLMQALRNELEWIPLKALRRDRDERYSSPAALAEDIAQYIRGRPLSAGPRSRTYILKKFLKRNKWSTFAVAGGLAALLTGVAVALVQWRAAIRSELSAIQQREVADGTTRFLRDAFSAVRPELARGREVTLQEVLDKASTSLAQDERASPAVVARIRGILGQTYFLLSDMDTARAQLKSAASAAEAAWGRMSTEAVTARAGLAIINIQTGVDSAAIGVSAKELLTLRPDQIKDASEAWGTLISVAALIGDRDTCEKLLLMAEATMDRAHEPPNTVDRALASFVRAMVEFEGPESIERMRSALAICEPRDPSHPSVLDMRGSLRMRMESQGRAQEAQAYSEETVARIRSITSRPSRLLADEIKEQGVLARARGEPAVAIERGREAIAIYKQCAVLCEGAGVLSAYDLVGFCLNSVGRNQESVDLYDEALATLASCPNPSPTPKYYFCHNQAVALSRLGNFQRAIEGLEMARSQIPEMDPHEQPALTAQIAAKLEKLRKNEPL